VQSSGCPAHGWGWIVGFSPKNLVLPLLRRLTKGHYPFLGALIDFLENFSNFGDNILLSHMIQLIPEASLRPIFSDWDLGQVKQTGTWMILLQQVSQFNNYYDQDCLQLFCPLNVDNLARNSTFFRFKHQQMTFQRIFWSGVDLRMVIRWNCSDERVHQEEISS